MPPDFPETAFGDFSYPVPAKVCSKTPVCPDLGVKKGKLFARKLIIPFEGTEDGKSLKMMSRSLQQASRRIYSINSCAAAGFCAAAVRAVRVYKNS